MTAAYFVVYEGAPHDPDTWVEYYLDEHVPLVRKFPRVRSVDVHVVDVHVGAATDGVFLITRLLFDTLDDLEAAITSPQRETARADMNHNLLPHFSGTVRHHTTELLASDSSPES